MPIDCSPIGLNLTFPADAARLAYYDAPADYERVVALWAAVAQVDISTLKFATVGGKDTFRADNRNSIHTRSYIDFPVPGGAPVRYYVRAHIGSGAYGMIGRISTNAPGATDRILKLQLVNWEADPNEVIDKIKEAMINYILHSAYPGFINQLINISMGPRIQGSRVRIVYVLEKLNQTMQDRIQAFGNPPGAVLNPAGFSPRTVAIGGYLKDSLCTIARGLERIYDDLEGNHGDCKPDNIMDNKLIDFGLSRVKYEGTWLSAGSTYNTRSSTSRDLTILIWNAWHYTDGYKCSIRDTLRPLLGWPNPDATVFSEFESWADRNAAPIPDPGHAAIPVDSRSYFRMITIPARVAALKAARLAAFPEPGEGATEVDKGILSDSITLTDAIYPIGLAPLYLYFNAFDNPNCTFDRVIAAMCDPIVPAIGGRRPIRKVASKYQNRTRRYNRKNANRRTHRRTHRKAGRL